MADTRTLSSSSSSTTNHVNGTTTASPLPSDLNNVTGLTTYVSIRLLVDDFFERFYFALGEYDFSANGGEIFSCK